MLMDIGGTRLYFDVEGAQLIPTGPRMQQRPTVILLHGGPGVDHSVFKPALSPLSHDVQLIYLDLRGQGRSDRSKASYWNIHQWAQDVHEFCKRLEIHQPVILGSSLGGTIAMAYAIAFPEHPAGLILCSALAHLHIDRMLQRFEELGGTLAREIAERGWVDLDPSADVDYARICLPLYYTTAQSADIRRRVRGSAEVSDHFVRGGEFARFDLRANLAAIRCPVLLLAGSQDPVCTAQDCADIMNGLTAGRARYKEFPHCGHEVFPDDPVAAVAAIREFISALPRP